MQNSPQLDHSFNRLKPNTSRRLETFTPMSPHSVPSSPHSLSTASPSSLSSLPRFNVNNNNSNNNWNNNDNENRVMEPITTSTIAQQEHEQGRLTAATLPKRGPKSPTSIQTQARIHSEVKKNFDSEDLVDSDTLKEAIVSIRVRRSILTNALGNGLSKFGVLDQIANLFKKRVLVQATPHGRFDSVFYAPFPHHQHQQRHLKRERGDVERDVVIKPEKVRFLNVGLPATDEEGMVAVGDGFDVSVVGMCITPQDTFAHDFNELLLYSVHRADDAEARELVDAGILNDSGHRHDYHNYDSDGDSTQQQEKKNTKKNFMEGGIDNRGVVRNKTKKNENKKNGDMDTFPLLRAGEVPRIHYDPLGDGYTAETLPNTFIPIPASSSRVLRRLPDCYSHAKEGDDACSCSGVSLRFTVMEIDKVTQAQVAALAGLESGSRAASAAGASLPYAGLLTAAASAAANLGKVGLRRYARPDFVMSADIFFRLSPKRQMRYARSNPINDGKKSGIDAAGIAGAASDASASGNPGVAGAANEAGEAGNDCGPGVGATDHISSAASGTEADGDTRDVTGDRSKAEGAKVKADLANEEAVSSSERPDEHSTVKFLSGDTYLRVSFQLSPHLYPILIPVLKTGSTIFSHFI